MTERGADKAEADAGIWTEKYRPQRLDDVINQRHIVERLKEWAKRGSIPNMLFAGPAGVGKTTVAICLAKELFGTNWVHNFQETNASDSRGIDIIRGRIKDFAKMKPLGAKFKIIFLDESDALTPEAQQALRRTMEKFSGVARFILSCNYSSRLIEPIQSRTAVFRFRALSEEHITEFLARIAKGERLDISKDAYPVIFELSGGDLRKAINILQASAILGKVTTEVVYDVTAQARPKDVKEMIETAISGDFMSARERLYELLIHQGLAGEDILKEIHRQVFELEIPEESKLGLIEKIGEFEFRMNQGSTEEIQLEALLAQFLKAGRR